MPGKGGRIEATSINSAVVGVDPTQPRRKQPRAKKAGTKKSAAKKSTASSSAASQTPSPASGSGKAATDK